MDIQIRGEHNDDVEHIHQLTELAFRHAPHTDHTEQFIVQALRRAGALTVSQVAVLNGEIVGHVAISPVEIADGSANWFGLGPISVLPDYQRMGIGSKLMTSALAELEAKGAAGCVVLGDPDYYGRFRFRAVEGLVFPGVPEEYFQALLLHGELPQGAVRYHAGFEAKR